VALHAAVLGIIHPETGQKRVWKSDLPRDIADLVKRMRGSRTENG
jgi:hypothetical protein